MRYLSGVVYTPCLRWKYGGLMLTPNMGNAPCLDGVLWAADNGCFTDDFTEDHWLKFLKKKQGLGYCLFAVAPDVPFSMRATLERSLPWLPSIRSLGYPAALAIQNGVDSLSLPWQDFDAVFIAGDKPFKTSLVAWEICQEAKSRGKWVHVARRNSYKALQEAYDMGADTCDGTFLKFGPDKNWPRMQRWFRYLKDCHEVGLWDGLPRVVTESAGVA